MLHLARFDITTGELEMMNELFAGFALNRGPLITHSMHLTP